MVNRKFIVPCMTSYDPKWPKDYLYLGYGGMANRMEDVCKALCFITGKNYDCVGSLDYFVRDNKLVWGKTFEWGFFRCKGFKKGTMHFEFKDEEVWMKFNREVAKQRGWVLPKKKCV